MDFEKQFDLIILGAGVSGLSAAEKFLSINPKLKLAILEARDVKKKI